MSATTHTTTTTLTSLRAEAKRAMGRASRAWTAYRKARRFCEEQASLYGGTDREAYKEAEAAFYQAEAKADEAECRLTEANRAVALAEAWQEYTDGADLAVSTLADLLDTYRRLVTDGYEESPIDEAVWIVADAQ